MKIDQLKVRIIRQDVTAVFVFRMLSRNPNNIGSAPTEAPDETHNEQNEIDTGGD